MDNLTHGAIGILTGWIRKVDPAREEPDTDRAVPWATFMAAEAPDLDVFIRRIPGLEWVGHRGITHTLVALPFTALAVALVCKLFWRRARFWPVFWWAMLGMFIGHLVADVITWTGIRPLLPWSNWRLSYPIMPFIDLFLTIPLLTAVLIGRYRPQWRRNLALGIAASVLLFEAGRSGAYLMARTVSAGAAAVPSGHRIVSLQAGGGYLVREVNWWAPWRVAEYRLPPQSDDPRIRNARRELESGSFLLRMGQLYYLTEQRGEVLRVTQVNLRSQFPLGYPWVEIDSSGKIVRQGRDWWLDL